MNEKCAIIAIGGLYGWGRWIMSAANEADAIDLARDLSAKDPTHAFCQVPAAQAVSDKCPVKPVAVVW